MKIKRFLTSRRGIPIILIIVLWNVFRFSLGHIGIVYRDFRMPFEIRPVYNEIILFDNEGGDTVAYLQKGNNRMFLTEQGEIRKANLKSEEDLKLLDSIFLVYRHPESYSDGVATLSGKDVIPPGRFREIFLPFDQGRLIARNDKYESFLVDMESDIVKKLDVRAFDGFSEGFALFSEYRGKEAERKEGYINTNGEISIDAQFDSARKFVNGYAAVAKYFGRAENGSIIERWGLIDKQGRLVIDCKYLDIGDYGEGLIAFSTEEIKVTRWAYEDVDFGDSVKKNVYGYMDINENVVIEPQYVEASRFLSGVARAIPIREEKSSPFQKFEWRYIDKDNNVLTELLYSVHYEEVDRNDEYIVLRNKSNGKVGMIANPSAKTDNDQK
jgi:hypothetical protein